MAYSANSESRPEKLNENAHGTLEMIAGAEVPIRYSIKGRPAFATVTVFLDTPDSRVKAESGAMVWMDSQVDVQTSCDGFCDSCMRQCAGETGCFNTYSGPGFVTFGFDEPGDILPFAVVPGVDWVVNARAFIAGTPDLSVSAKFSGCSAYCLGEGLFFTKISTNEKFGVFFAGGYGQIVKHDIPEGATMMINNSLFFAAAADTNREIAVLGNLYTCCWGGEGLMMKIRGPAIVYTQSRDPTVMDQLIRAKNLRKKGHSKGNTRQ